jgi:hypothetical protein
MGIRITDQAGDHHTQNPPPEHDAGAMQPQSKVVATAANNAAADSAPVLKGPQIGHSLSFIQYVELESPAPIAADGIAKATGGPGKACDPAPGPTQSLRLPTASIGWVRRDTGATQRIGAPEDHEVRKLAPRWALAALNIASQISGQQTVRVTKNK